MKAAVVSSQDKNVFIKQLSKELLAEKDEIVSLWVKQIKSFGGSYIQVDTAELASFCEEFIYAFIEVLAKGSMIKLRRFIGRISHIRSSQGFMLSEVQKAYYSFCDVVKPIVRQVKLRKNSVDKVKDGIIDSINSIMIDTLFELSEAYHRTLDDKLDRYVDEIEKINVKLKDTSIRDDMTGCYNRRYFESMLDSEIERSRRYKRPLSLTIFDIDHFKDFNDKYGHAFGDEILKNIGVLLRKMTRGSDTVYRYGGEEFSVILPETNNKKAHKCAERIREKIYSNIFCIKGKRLKIAISGGVSGFDKELLSKKRLVTMADKALYQAKKTGRNKIALCGNSNKKTAGS